MSKELIELLRADAESTDDIGLCADAADRIEELERRLEKALDILGADTQIDAEANFVALRQELDALQADNARLREALELTHDQAIKGRIFPTIASPTYWVNAVELALVRVRKP